MNFDYLIMLIVPVFVFLILSWFFKKQMEGQFVKLSKEVLNSSQEEFLRLFNEKMKAERELAQADLDSKKQAVESTVKDLKEELEKYEKLIHDFEQDRTRKYGNLENELKRTSLETSKLQDTTDRLTNILGNVKKRGEWGERQAEVIIGLCGLIEGKNYKKQAMQSSTGTKPDYTFLLPDSHKINMDVKFPLDNYMNFVNSEEEMQREHYKKEFLKNVNERIKEIQNRDYINPEENTLDFVLLFIPNEQVYGFINENVPDLMDRALRQKVVLCSPLTLYAMLSVIRQSFENFHYEKATKEIIKRINLFTKTYEIFKNRFEKLGTLIENVGDQYDQINSKSFKELDTKIRRINEYKKGHTPSIEVDKDTIDITGDVLDDESVQ